MKKKTVLILMLLCGVGGAFASYLARPSKIVEVPVIDTERMAAAVEHEVAKRLEGLEPEIVTVIDFQTREVAAPRDAVEALARALCPPAIDPRMLEPIPIEIVGNEESQEVEASTVTESSPTVTEFPQIPFSAQLHAERFEGRLLESGDIVSGWEGEISCSARLGGDLVELHREKFDPLQSSSVSTVPIVAGTPQYRRWGWTGMAGYDINPTAYVSAYFDPQSESFADQSFHVDRMKFGLGAARRVSWGEWRVYATTDGSINLGTSVYRRRR